MDAINMIFENYGGERITRIFKSYWLILLIIKQVMFSLFFIQPSPEPLPVNTSKVLQQEVTQVQPEDTTFKGLNFFRVLITLALLDTPVELEKDELPDNPSSKKLLK